MSVTTSAGPDGASKVVTIPDGRGGQTRITIDKNGVSVNGVAANGVSTNGDGAPTTTMRAGRGRPFPTDIPPGVEHLLNNGLVALVMIVIGFPFARAIARKIERREPAPLRDSDSTQRLQAIENAVESIAVEVERISEGQRFTTKLLSERSEDALQLKR